MSSTPSSYSIRPARVEEATVLTQIALRSKAHWGYSAEFMAAARAELSVTFAQLSADIAFVWNCERQKQMGKKEAGKYEVFIYEWVRYAWATAAKNGLYP